MARCTLFFVGGFPIRGAPTPTLPRFAGEGERRFEYFDLLFSLRNPTLGSYSLPCEAGGEPVPQQRHPMCRCPAQRQCMDALAGQ